MTLRPEFFDILGIGVFGFITVLAAWSLKTQRPLPTWSVVLLFIIGVLGLVVDGTIVFLSYLR